MNPVSVCYDRICSVILHRRSGKANEQNPVVMVKYLILKQILNGRNVCTFICGLLLC